MRRWSILVGTLSFASVAACGVTVRPHVRTGGSEQPPGVLPGGRLSPRPDPEGTTDEATPIIDQVCRTTAIRTGWLAIRYFESGEDCPKSTDPGNAYNAAVIERYSLKPIGATMVVCADQTIPRDWVRDHDQDSGAGCPGARVREGERTAITIRRVTQRSSDRQA